MFQDLKEIAARKVRFYRILLPLNMSFFHLLKKRTIRNVKKELSKKRSMRNVTVTLRVKPFHSSRSGGTTYITALMKKLTIFLEGDFVFKREICLT